MTVGAAIDTVREEGAAAAAPRDQLDRPLRDLRISVIDACNFRCTYCMPVEKYPEHYTFLHRRDRLSFAEILRFVRLAIPLGVSKIRLTGGEPLLRKNLPDLVRDLIAIDGVDDLALTTNGYWLADQAQALRDAGLLRLNVSLDAIDDEVFAAMNGRGYGVQRVLDGIAAAAEAGFAAIKMNVVIQRGVNDHQLLEMIEYFRGSPHVLRFIEYMDVGNLNHWQPDDVVPSAEILERVRRRYPLEPVEPNYTGEVARRYRFTDGAGEIGFISSVTQTFCGDCHRARLSADGKLYTCLFANTGTDFRALLRGGAGDDEIQQRLRRLWQDRKDRYSELRAELRAAGETRKVEMYEIGG